MYQSTGMPEFYQESKKGKFKIIDVREVDEYEMGHIPGVKNLPLSGISETFNSLGKSETYHIISQYGGRSAMACEFLGNQGYNVVNVLGGMSSWMGDVE